MERVRRRAGWVLGLGLVGGLVWTAVVTLSQPGWYDPTRDCSRKLGPDSTGVHTSWFPPTASCLYGDESRAYMSTSRTVVLSILAVPLLIIIVTGLILTVRRLTGDPGPIRPAGDLDLRKRWIKHLTFGAADLAIVFAPLTFLNAVAIVFGAIPGGILFILTSLVALSAICTALDRHLGPLPSSALDSRRRGTIAGVTTYAVVFAATAVTGGLPFLRLWSVPLGGITYAVIVAVQWHRLRGANANQVQYSG